MALITALPGSWHSGRVYGIGGHPPRRHRLFPPVCAAGAGMSRSPGRCRCCSDDGWLRRGFRGSPVREWRSRVPATETVWFRIEAIRHLHCQALCRTVQALLDASSRSNSALPPGHQMAPSAPGWGGTAVPLERQQSPLRSMGQTSTQADPPMRRHAAGHGHAPARALQAIMATCTVPTMRTPRATGQPLCLC